MKKYDSIHIFNYQPNLVYAQLSDLGRVNILCGKNSSGKSTVLNAINELSKKNVIDSNDEVIAFQNPDHDVFVIDTIRTQFSIDEFNLNTLSKIDSVFDEEYSHSKASNQPFTREFIFEKLKAFLAQDYFKNSPALEKISFIDYFSSFLSATNLYEHCFDPDGESYYILPTRIIQELADQIFPSRKSVKLIPNDRNLISNCKIKDYKLCEITSERLINYIHFCNGQLTDSKKRKSFSALQKAFNEISEGYSFEIIIKDGLELELLFSNREGKWINADNSGLGLRDLLVILSYIILLESDIFLIEEPERHLHSSTQRRLLMYLSKQDKQFFIATHSNVFLDLDYVDSIFLTEYVKGKIQVTNESNKARALIELGYSVADNIVSDLVILTEGPSDKGIIEHFLLELGALKSKIVKFWPLGGDIMDTHDLSVLKDSYNVIALVDNDPGSSLIRTRFTVKCTELGINCHRLQRYSIENYITLEALRRQFSTQIPSSLTSIDPNIKLQNQIGLNVKNTLNRVVKHMTFSDIKGTDLGDFILEVKRLLE